MKRTLLFIACVLASLAMPAQEQELSASEPISSGCLTRSYGEEAPAYATIKLTKEGNILSVDLYNYESNCGTRGFEVDNRISDGNDDTPSVFISVVPVIPAEMDCYCPFNISYTVRDFEKNKFYLTCWWFEGLVELTEGEPLVLEYKTVDVVIDDLKFTLLKTTHQAQLLCQESWNGESQILKIPSEVEYEGEKYTVTSINEQVYGLNNAITKIIIPKTIKNTGFGSLEGITINPFASCSALETIEVEEGNPAICSIDGVLFNKDKTALISYPVASLRESYTVPDGVATIAQSAFCSSKNIKKVILPNCVETLNFCTFLNCISLEEVILSPNIKEIPVYLFKDCNNLKSVVIPEGVTTIGYSAFEGCSSLESISLPESVMAVDFAAFRDCKSLKSATLSPNLKEIPTSMFRDCSMLTEVIMPFGINTIGAGAFAGCESMQSFDLPESINYIDGFAFRYISNLKDIYCHATTIPNTDKHAFNDVDLSKVTLHVPAASIDAYQAVEPWKNYREIVALPEQEMAYRPFIEDGKVWKLGGSEFGSGASGNPVWRVEYYYFDGDTIINGKNCKQMMRQRYVSPNHPDYDNFSKLPPLSYVGAWYEEYMKVYFYNAKSNQFSLWYDFSLDAYDTLQIDQTYGPYVLGPRQTGGIKGFKGVYRDVMMCPEGESMYNTTWLEGIGSIDGPIYSVYYGSEAHLMFLMSCTVGDEVIYYNDEYEDEATPAGIKDRKRFDFTHTIKTQPKAPIKRVKSDAFISSSEREVARPEVKAPRKDMGARTSSSAEEGQTLYGEYNDQQLSINLNPLDEAYTVYITDESGKVAYEKSINAGNIVGLSIDISTYAAGRYTVTVENSQESFTGQFEALTTGISDAERLNDKGKMINDNVEMINSHIYNLQGQRLSTLQKGLNIINGQKVYVK